MLKKQKIFLLLTITLLGANDCRTPSENVRRDQNVRCAEIGKLAPSPRLVRFENLTRQGYADLLRAGIDLLDHDERAVKCVKLLKEDLIATDKRERCLRQQVQYYESSPLPGSVLVGIKCKE